MTIKDVIIFLQGHDPNKKILSITIKLDKDTSLSLRGKIYKNAKTNTNP